jgi:hypothetical protein
MLFCVKLGIKCPISYVNEDYEIRKLVSDGLLEENGRVLTAKGTKVHNDISKEVEKKPTLPTIDEEFAKEYLSCFPRMVLPSNKPARVASKLIIKNLSWFINTYPQYDRETIIAATKYYVRKFKDQEYKYMRNSQYFISKESTNRMISSTLAEFCQLIVDGIEDDEPKDFETKVL